MCHVGNISSAFGFVAVCDCGERLWGKEKKRKNPTLSAWERKEKESDSASMVVEPFFPRVRASSRSSPPIGWPRGKGRGEKGAFNRSEVRSESEHPAPFSSRLTVPDLDHCPGEEKGGKKKKLFPARRPKRSLQAVNFLLLLLPQNLPRMLANYGIRGKKKGGESERG